MKKKLAFVYLALALVAGIVFLPFGVGQNLPGTGSNTVTTQATTPWFSTTPISATAAVNAQTTLTIPAPSSSGLYNYICSLAYEISNNGTAGSGASVVVSTNTNFGTFAVKVSQPATASTDSGVQMLFSASPAGGCAKSAVAGTATTFVSPASLTYIAWTWYATYYQAP